MGGTDRFVRQCEKTLTQRRGGAEKRKAVGRVSRARRVVTRQLNSMFIVLSHAPARLLVE